MDEIKKRFSIAFDEIVSYWYLYYTEGHGKFSIINIQPVAGSLYQVRIEMFLWTSISFDVLYIDGKIPAVFIDAYVTSHLVEHLIKQKVGN